MLMTLGWFVFSLGTVPYRDFQRQITWRYPSTQRVGTMPAHQYLGRDDEPITLAGVLLPEITGGEISLDRLERMGDEAKAWPLIDGTGRNYGMYVITDLSCTRTLFFSDGAARRIEFSLKLKRIDERHTDLLGVLPADLVQ